MGLQPFYPPLFDAFPCFVHACQLLSTQNVTKHCRETVKAHLPHSSKQLAAEYATSCLIAGRFLIVFAAVLLAQATPELVRGFAGGDPTAAVRALTTMSSLHSLVEVFINPIFGRLSDSYGRKPFLIFSASMVVLFRTPVGLAPSWPTMVLSRVFGGSTIGLFTACTNASMSDLLEGKELAMALERIRMWVGASVVLAPIAGGWISTVNPRYCYLGASACALATMALIGTCFEETLPREKWVPRKSGLELLRSVNPLSFLTLFRRGTALRRLTLVQVRAGKNMGARGRYGDRKIMETLEISVGSYHDISYCLPPHQ
jgi:MFS family permease